MELRDLQYLIAIGEAGNLVRAAERLGVTQPTLSKAVTRLERAFRVKLVERLARGVRLTPPGEAVAARLVGIDVGVRDMMAEVLDIRQGKAGAVTFGVGTGIPPAFVAAALKPLLETNSIAVTVIGGRADVLVRAVRAGDVEFALTVATPQKANLASAHPLDAMPIRNASARLVDCWPVAPALSLAGRRRSPCGGKRDHRQTGHCQAAAGAW